MPKKLSEIDKSALHETDRAGRTQLMKAMVPHWTPPEPKPSVIHRHRTKVVARLIELGTDVNASDKKGRTALHFAAQERLPSICEMLLAAGADPNAADAHGATPLWRAVFAQSLETVEVLMAHGTHVDRESQDLAETIQGGEEIFALLSSTTSKKKTPKKRTPKKKTPKKRTPKTSKSRSK